MVIYRITPTGESHSQAIQKQLFANGFEWVVYGQMVREISSPIYINPKTKRMALYEVTLRPTVEDCTLSELLQK